MVHTHINTLLHTGSVFPEREKINIYSFIFPKNILYESARLRWDLRMYDVVEYFSCILYDCVLYNYISYCNIHFIFHALYFSNFTAQI